MFNQRTITKEEQHQHNLADRAAWENNVTLIFWGFLAVFIALTVIESAFGLWIMRQIPL